MLKNDKLYGIYKKCGYVCWCKAQTPKNWSGHLLLKVQGACKQKKTQSKLAVWKMAGKILKMLERF